MLFQLIATLALLILPSYSLGQSTFQAFPAKQYIPLTGFTRARATLDIVSQVSGTCLRLHADAGEAIGENGIFAEIDPILARLDLDAVRIELKQARRQLLFDELQVKRFGRLLSTKASSRSRLDELELHRDRSRLQIDMLTVKEKRLAEILRRHTVLAPAGWRLIKRMVEEGQWVRSGTVLGRAGDYRTLIVPLALTPTELTALQTASSLEISLPDQHLHGQATIHKISPAFDPATRKISVEIRLQPQLLAKLPEKRGGLRVELLLPLDDPMQSFLAPAGAVEERYEEHWLTRDNGEKIRVIVLGPAKAPTLRGKWLRVASPEIRPGDTFLLPGPK